MRDLPAKAADARAGVHVATSHHVAHRHVARRTSAGHVGRRDLERDQFTVLLGLPYQARKQHGARTNLASAQNDQQSTAAERTAAEHGVHEETAARAAALVEELSHLLSDCRL